MNQRKINDKYSVIMTKNFDIIEYQNNRKKFIQKEKELTLLYKEVFDEVCSQCKIDGIKNENNFGSCTKNMGLQKDIKKQLDNLIII